VKKVRLLLVITLVVVIALPAASAVAKGNPKANGGGTTVEGGEKSTFTFNAVQRKDGTVKGHLVYHFRTAGFSFRMKIDCLRIVGNQAGLSGTVTKVSDSAPGFVFVGQKGVFSVIDNGQGHGASPDLISDVLLYGGASCLNAFPAPYLPMQGNITVQS